MSKEPSRYATVSCVVVGHRPYGLLVEIENFDLEGFVDSADIGDPPFGRDDWPATGSRVRGVVLGTARIGRTRLSTRPRDVDFVDAVPDPAQAFREWEIIDERGSADISARDEFYRSSNASAILKWALGNAPNSANRKLAAELLAAAPDQLRTQVLGP